MLSLFPSLLSWNQLAPTLIRLTLGAVFIYFAYKAYRSGEMKLSKTSMSVTIFEAVVGILIFIGLFTQVAALVAAIDLVVRLAIKVKNRAFLTDGVNYYLILLVMCLTLLVTGAGFLSFDLPM